MEAPHPITILQADTLHPSLILRRGWELGRAGSMHSTHGGPDLPLDTLFVLIILVAQNFSISNDHSPKLPAQNSLYGNNKHSLDSGPDFLYCRHPPNSSPEIPLNNQPSSCNGWSTTTTNPIVKPKLTLPQCIKVCIHLTINWQERHNLPPHKFTQNPKVLRTVRITYLGVTKMYMYFL